MPVYSLGRFDFVTLAGIESPATPPPIPRETLIPIDRPGVDGTAFVVAGIKAEPAQLYSAVDVASDALVRTLYLGYRDLIAAAPQNVVWRDVDWSDTYGTKFQVLDVRLLSARRLTAASGGLGGGTFWVEALWTVWPIPVF